MRAQKRIYRFLPLLILLGAGFGLRLRGQEEAPQRQEEEPLIAVNWVEDLNSAITNDLSRLPAMDQVVDSFMNRWSLKGVSLAVMRNDSLLYARGYGKADPDTPMTPGTRMRLASVSKLFTAVGIMRLQEEGKLSLNTPVFGPFGILNQYDRYIRDDDYCLITVEHLLRHQAGFTTRGGDVMFSTPQFMRRHGLKEPPTTAFLVQKELARPLFYEPGTYQEYSNFGYLLASLVIEKVSGMSYEDYMRQQVFEAARCHGFRLGGNYLKDRQPGETRYFTQPDDKPVASFDGKFAAVSRCYGGNDVSGLYGAGGWVGSAVELARLVASIDGTGPVPDLLEPSSVRQMTLWFDDESYGLGWQDCRPEGEWTRTGSFAGTSALIKKYADGECWIFITNTSTWRGAHFTRNSGRLCRNLRSRFGDSLPVRDLFRE